MAKCIVCFGDSNTYGFRADLSRGEQLWRYPRDRRWTGVLQNALGGDYRVQEEGVVGRTTAFSDPIKAGMSGLADIGPCLLRHRPVDLLVVMLGTNEVKARFGLEPGEIAGGMERLVQRAGALPVWAEAGPRILIMAPPHISPARDPEFHRKSAQLASHYRALAQRQGCLFLDTQGIGEFHPEDTMHLTEKGHLAIGKYLAELIPELLK